MAGVFHNCAIVSIDKRYPKHAQKVMHAIWGAGLMSLTKLIVIVDADCDVHDYTDVAWRAFGNVDYDRDLRADSRVPVDHLDHASYQQFYGGKVGIDATAKLPTEGYDRGWPPIITQDPGHRVDWWSGVGRSTDCEQIRGTIVTVAVAPGR